MSIWISTQLFGYPTAAWLEDKIKECCLFYLLRAEKQNSFLHKSLKLSSCSKRNVHQLWLMITTDVGSISVWSNWAQDPMKTVTAEGRLDPECEWSPIRTTVFCLHDAGCSPIYIQSHCVTISNLHCIANLRCEQDLICIIFENLNKKEIVRMSNQQPKCSQLFFLSLYLAWNNSGWSHKFSIRIVVSIETEQFWRRSTSPARGRAENSPTIWNTAQGI